MSVLKEGFGCSDEDLFEKRSASQTYSPPARSPPPFWVGVPRIAFTALPSTFGSVVPSRSTAIAFWQLTRATSS